MNEHPANAPDWALALLEAVEEFEDYHPKSDECLADALDAVPADVRMFVRGWVRGRSSQPLAVRVVVKESGVS